MKTYIFEGIATATSSICHNGGEKNGVVTQLRREKFVNEKGEVVEIPLISGNSIRGKLRDIAAIEHLTSKDDIKQKVEIDMFNILFTGGSLEGAGDEKGIDIKKIKQLRKEIPMLSLLGGSYGNCILPGKIDVGKMIPIAKETAFLIPEKFTKDKNLLSVWELCQVEMYTRKDDKKDEILNEFLNKEEVKESKTQQMMYHIETIAAGTKFYWKVFLRDTTEIETGCFLKILQKWNDLDSRVGGNARVGHGYLKLEILETKEIDSNVAFDNPDFVRFIEKYDEQKS